MKRRIAFVAVKILAKQILNTSRSAHAHPLAVCLFFWIAGHFLVFKLQMEFMMWTECIWEEQEVFVDIPLCKVYHRNVQRNTQYSWFNFFKVLCANMGVRVCVRACNSTLSCSWLLKAAQSIRLYCAGNLNALHSQMQMQMPLHNVALELHVQFSQHQCAAQCSAHERILIAYLNHN